MKTLDYLKRYAYTYFYAAAAVLLFASLYSHAATEVASIAAQSIRPVIVIDAGHGGMDGGTVSCTGVSESGINLQIALRLDDLLGLMGYDTIMVRTDDTDLGTEGDSVREKKNSDLRNRAGLVNQQENAILVSIHQNHFPQSQYSGPQVFYAAAGDSKSLAEALQASLNSTLGSSRAVKKADGVYLMEHIDTTGILVECGFLSNPNEEALLQKPAYQQKLCSILAATLAQYIENPAAV